MPDITIQRDPFRPHLRQETIVAPQGVRLDTVLRREGFIVGRGKSLVRTRTFVVQLNGSWKVQSAWHVRLRKHDVVAVVVLPAGGGGSNPLQVVAMAALAAATAGVGAWAASAYAGAAGVAATSAAALTVGAGAATAVGLVGGMVVNSLFPPARLPGSLQREKASPTYTLSAQGNMARPMEAIPARYGRYRSYLDFAAQPYTEMVNNQTHLYQLFCVGQGRYEIEEIRIEETPIGNFSEVEYEVVEPGGQVTLFPDNVVTSAEVQGIELPAINVEGAGPKGPFAANPPGTLASEIAIDILLPKGLFYAAHDGTLESAGTGVNVYARQIDDSGKPIGTTIVLGRENIVAATLTPQYRTFRYKVEPGRWEISVERNSGHLAERATRMIRDVTWLGLRSYLPSQRTYGNVTMLAVAMRATGNLNQTTARRINIIATRRLRTWDPVQGWSQDLKPTRNPAWAIADACTDREYGRGLPDSRINLAALYRLAKVWDERGDWFDGVFDVSTTFWEAVTQIARAGRALPIYHAGVIDVIRDEPKSVRTQMFTPANIVTRSFSVDYVFPAHDDPDYIIVEFVNERTWKDDEVECAWPGAAKRRPYRLRLVGVTGRAQAWREGMALLARNRDQRRFASFQTELEGAIPGYADLVEISHDVPKWGLSGIVEDYDPRALLLTTSEPLQWWQGQNHYISLRGRDGGPAGPFRVEPGSHEREMRIADLVDGHGLYISTGETEEPTHYTFGPGERRALLAQVMRAVPSEGGLWTLDLVNYAPSVHTAELGGQEPEFASPSLLPIVPLGPIVDGVTVFSAPRPGQQIVSATPASGAYRYEFEASDDGGVHWQPLGMAELPSLEVHLRAGSWQVRVRGVGALSGPWKTWQGNVSASAAPPPRLSALTAVSQVMAIELAWTVPDAPWISSVEIWESSTSNLGDASLMGEFRLPQSRFTRFGLSHGTRIWFWGRIRDEAGQVGPWYPDGQGVPGSASSDAGKILDYLSGQIGPEQLTRDLTQTISGMGRNINTVTAKLDQEREERLNQDGALARRVEAAIAANGASATAVKQTSTALSSLDGRLRATWSVQTQVAQDGKVYAAGMALGAYTNERGRVQTSVYFLADRFAFLNLANGKISTPFVVQNGQTFLNKAFIGTAWIKSAQIESLDAGKIVVGVMSADRINAESLIAKLASFTTAYVKTAHIGVAQVDTLRLASGAVVTGSHSIISKSLGRGGSELATVATGSLYLPYGGSVVVFMQYAQSGGRFPFGRNTIVSIDGEIIPNALSNPPDGAAMITWISDALPGGKTISWSIKARHPVDGTYYIGGRVAVLAIQR
ncbi:phage-related conserved hypothetical protein [Bordetella bronchiseptica 1289]|uniref:host specificity factor TipJ family phage tail protein n=1 Tax=Bordetella bronchiseptica TaxID=518 RepID=UPI00029030AE|nr:host specificity factor TipJ family phage tail protein [Bordetella bronchiseptica]CCN24112.1 phage-related conserved hypothetical protein [Bordetella bronchiseptica 1289]